MQHEVDADFARYVRARQRRLLRAAYLVCGDQRAAQDVVEGALATVAGRWSRVKEYPDTVVRQHLYRDAIAAAKRARRESLAAELAADARAAAAGPAADHGSGDLMRALDALSPQQRALVVLRHFDERSEADAAEVLGDSVGDVTRQTEAAVALLGAAGTPDLGEQLEVASQAVVEVDLAERAWGTALSRRGVRRRRLFSAVGGVAAVAVVLAVAQGVDRRSDPPVPVPTTATTAPVKRLPDGTMYAAMPLEGAEDRLPDYDAGLPSAIDPRGRAVRLSTLGRPPASVVAVYLRRAGTHYRAVLVPKDRTQVVVDNLDLVPTRDADGNDGVPLGPKAISPEGQWVVFPQPGAVVRLDLATGKVDRYAVPAQDLQVAGWGQGRSVVARSATRAWRLDLAQGGARAIATAMPAPITEGVGLPVTQLVGEAVSAGRWSASGAMLNQLVTSSVIVRGNGPIYQGLVAVDAESRSGRVLLAPESPDGRTGRSVGCCTVLAWADPSTLLFRSTGYDGSWVLAWDVETGRVYDVTRLDQGGGVDYPRALALAVGSRG